MSCKALSKVRGPTNAARRRFSATFGDMPLWNIE
jgi:hypothetical protein